MIGLGPLAFAAPWILTALIALPALWLLLRVIPPTPLSVKFPALRFLLGLESREETAARTPWWLLLLRLTVAALLILALARPLLHPAPPLTGTGPLLIVLDTGWGAAADWDKRIAVASAALDQAERQGRPAALLATARTAEDAAPALFGPRRAAEVQTRLASLRPQPWPTDRAGALTALQGFEPGAILSVLYLNDGQSDGALAPLLARLAQLGTLDLRAPETLPKLLVPPPRATSVAAANTIDLQVRRAEAGPAESVSLRLLTDAGQVIAQPTLKFADGETLARLPLTIPPDRRNDVARLDLVPEADARPTAAGTVLLDQGWQRRSVGLISSGALDRSQSLLDDPYYLDRALAPLANLTRAALDDLLKRPPSVILWPDTEAATLEQRSRLRAYVEGGGVLLRFAGARLAGMDAEEGPALLPVRLRPGDRALGTALQWTEPMPLAPFAATSPFAGLVAPKDVTVKRQVLAEPGPELAGRTWAQLSDGTPLVTAAPAGEGWLILMHVPARADWSSLPVSGVFIEMLERIIGLSHAVAGGAEAAVQAGVPLPPQQTLDGFAQLGPAASGAEAVPRAGAVTVGPRHPPGLYGASGAEAQRAVNLTAATATEITALRATPKALPADVRIAPLGGSAEVDLRPWGFTAALLLFLLDLLIAYGLRGLLTARGRFHRAGVAGVVVVLLLLPENGKAQAPIQMDPHAQEFALKATLDFRLAYIVTGDTLVDATSKAGLEGLSYILQRRTAVDAAEPMAVNIDQDDLAFFPLLYWPMADSQRPPTPEALERINRYLRTGGTILFDTRDGPYGEGGLGTRRLRALVRGLDIPPLAPAGPDHVLTKAFYLLQEFPGREAASPLWVQANPTPGGDEVSSILMTQSDLAGAWAMDKAGTPLYPVSPGGEVQREMAYRTGVNIVMYALTGNYKADQVHVNTILERLGQ